MPETPIVPAALVTPEVKAPVDTKVPVAPVSKAPIDLKSSDAKTNPSPKEVSKVIEKIKLGEGEEYTIEEIRAMKEKAKGADKKFLEASQARKEAIRFFKMAKENPREFLEKTGIDPKKFSYDEVARDIQDKLRDPKEVELEKAQQKLKEYEEKESAAKKQFEEERLSRQAKAIEERMHKEAIDALEKHPAIPKNGFSVARMAKYIDVVQQKTGVLLSFEDVASTIENDIRSDMKGMLKGASAEQIIDLIGKEGAELIRAYHLAQLKDPLKNGKGATTTNDNKPTEKKWKNSQDFWKTIDKAAKAERGE